MKSLLVSIILLSISMLSFAQFSINGLVLNEQGKPIVNAEIRLDNNKVTLSNVDGGFSFFNVEKAEVRMEISHLSYEGQQFNLDLKITDFIKVELKNNNYILDEISIASSWAGEDYPITQSNIYKEEIQLNNLGQDVPFLLDQTPNVVITSDAGAGIGYTGIRIRGSDPSRINISINGIPFNDSESQGTFWVNLPDFAASTDQIQIQRGIGTSTNGAGAFGATINLKTDTYSQKPKARLENTIGSFDTRKHNIQLSSGLLNNHWAFEGRLSTIKSDGYIDRASSDLNSYYLSGAYISDKTIIKGIHYSGHEITYQSWYGTPESRVNGDVEGMMIHALNNGLSEAQTDNLLNAGRTYNFYEYDNQVDNYNQDHYQLHFNHKLSNAININAALHYTHGFGYFEQFRPGDEFGDYGLDEPIINGSPIGEGDFIRRRWLDNDFYGITFNSSYEKDDWSFILGGAYNEYRGDHFGEIIWAQLGQDLNIRDRYYDNVGNKDDFNIYLKSTYGITDKLSLFADLQFRSVQYETFGLSSDLINLDVDVAYNFFNPKFGLSYALNNTSQIYASYSRGNREPVRADFVDALTDQEPLPESMDDFEFGFKSTNRKLSFEANAYFMNYQNQLVLSGALNDVGSPVRINVDQSYRAGVELAAGYAFNEKLSLAANLALSQNKIKAFDETVYDYTNGFEILTNPFSDTDISFSPNVVGGATLSYKPITNLDLQWRAKYVGNQFLDNTSDINRQLDAYLVNDLLIAYDLKFNSSNKLELRLKVNNVLNELYSANGYTFNYIFGEKIVENFLYPQATRNILIGINLEF
jgi:iron complex outermembrane receptor protein